MPLFHCIGLMAKVSIQEFQAQSLANVVWAFAQVQLNCGPFFETMNVQVARGVGQHSLGIGTAASCERLYDGIHWGRDSLSGL